MRRTTIVFLILLAFAITNKDAKAQFTILTPDNLPYTISQSHQIIGLNVNSDEDIEFALIFQSFASPLAPSLPPETEYATMFLCRPPYSGILAEPETITLPHILIPEINSPSLSFPAPSSEFPYVSLFPQGVRIENQPPNNESSWQNQAILAGDFPLFFSNDNNQTPLESSYIDGTTSGFIGARYWLNGKMYYGWIEISIDDSEPSITIESMVFQVRPDTSSYTGSMSVVPIAIISSLFSFFAIGIGVYYRRRRK